MDERALRHLDAAGGGGMNDWWIHRAIIRPNQIVSVDFLDGGQVAAIVQRMIEATRPARTSSYAMRMMSMLGVA
jgi:hypothetical protein